MRDGPQARRQDGSRRIETVGNYRAEEAVFEKLENTNNVVSYLLPIVREFKAVWEASDAALPLCLRLLPDSSMPLF
jgi:hypothetical protein